MTRNPRLNRIIEREILAADLREARDAHKPTRAILARLKAITIEILRGRA